MTADSPAPPGCLVDRLHAALDRLEIALDATAARLREADTASLVLKAMEQDRAALAAELDKARSRASSRSRAAVAAEAEVAAAARAVRDALEPEPPEAPPQGSAPAPSQEAPPSQDEAR
jgi:hypothetical protein